ncbi:hydroxymethylglutaryl-CoA synthase [Candidatus Roizmanbacteria bacterium]|nr:hydroxymethylglutaryl-CoA synthase [Candidatus Roizmanbacteria bacterium]
MVGIVSYGFYIPRNRIKVEEIARVWGKDVNNVRASLGIEEKAVSEEDEDSLTMAYESASMTLSDVKIKNGALKVIFFGSETPPYVVNPASTILGEFLGIDHNYLAYDTQFACKAATGAIISASSLIESNFTKYALVVGSDKANAKPHDTLEYTASSASVSLLLGKNDMILEVVDKTSYSSDTPDFWRREGIRYPSHGGRFTGKPSYFHHIRQASNILLHKTKIKPADFSYAIFHMPNGRFPIEVGLSLGFTKHQIEPSLIVRDLGNSYTASALMGLVATLEVAKPGEMIFLASYGSGAGSDAFIFRVNKTIEKRRRMFRRQMEEKIYIDYPTYLKFMHTI